MVFLSPLYSLGYETLELGLHRVIAGLPVASTAGKMSVLSIFVTLNGCDFLLYRPTRHTM